MMKRTTRGERIFAIFNILLLTLFGVAMLVPLLAVLSRSLSSPHAVNSGRVFIFPAEFTLASWQYIVGLGRVWRSFALTAGVTAVGTALSLTLGSMMAYPLSRKDFGPGRVILLGVSLTMIFKAPMIPYFLTLRFLGLFDNVLVLILPSLMGAYMLIVMVTFFRQLPRELEESAIIDGAGFMQVLFRIVMPVSKPMLATMGLMYAVSYWNQFRHPLLFIQNQNLYPLQLTLRSFIAGEEVVSAPAYGLDRLRGYNADTVQSAVVMFTVLPIVMVYPFLQRYFIKGVMIGSIKG